MKKKSTLLSGEALASFCSQMAMVLRAGYSLEEGLVLLSEDDPGLEQLLQDESRPIFIAEENGQVLGYGFCILKVTKDDPVLADHTTLYIDDLCVEETCRGKQIGKTVYTHIVEYAKSLGCDSVTLNVWAFNERAKGFNESLGLKAQKISMELLLEEH